MRQLDLFGSFFETPIQENIPGEKQVVSKKEEESSNFARAVAPSYSKNALRSERLVAQQATITNETPDPAENQEGSTAATSPVVSPLFLSLFDAPTKEIEAVIQDKEIDVTIEETQIEAQVAEDESAQINEPALSEDLPALGPEILIVEEQLEIAATSEPVVEVKKKSSESHPKKQKQPELQRNGSVIFDDGKITVKLKSTNPFPVPIAKEKKEKIKKPLQKRGRKSFKEIDAEVDLIEIPEDEVLFQKQYYPISEVAKWFRVNTSLLRFWENEFDVLKPRKNRKGDRLFRPEDVKNLQLIYQLLRQRKYTIEGAKEYIKTNKKKADIQLHLTNTLQKLKIFLLDLKVNLQP